MKTILALAAILSVALAQNVIFDAPYHHGLLGYHHGPPHGYLGNHLASGAVPGYAVWPAYLGHHLPVEAEKEEEEEAAVEEADRKKRDIVAVAPHHLAYSPYSLAYAAPAYVRGYAAPYAHHFAPYSYGLGYRQIPHGAPYYKVAATGEAKEEEATVEEASRKKRDIVVAHHALPYHGVGHGLPGYVHHPIPIAAPVYTHTYTAAVPVETEFKYKTHSYEDEDKPTPADTTLVALKETEHTGKAIHYEPKVFTYQSSPFLSLLGHKLAEAKKEEERKKRSVVLAHHGLRHFGLAHHGYSTLGYAHHVIAAPVPVETEHKYKTVHYEDTDAPTPADTTLVDAVEKEHTFKSVHFAPAFLHH